MTEGAVGLISANSASGPPSSGVAHRTKPSVTSVRLSAIHSAGNVRSALATSASGTRPYSTASSSPGLPVPADADGSILWDFFDR